MKTCVPPKVMFSSTTTKVEPGGFPVYYYLFSEQTINLPFKEMSAVHLMVIWI